MAKTESGWKMVRPAVGLWKMTRTEILASLAFVASIPGVVIGTLASVSTQSPYDAGLLFFFGMSGITVVSSLYFLAGIGRDGISRRAYYRFRHTHAGKTYSATPAGVKIQIPSTSRAGIVESN